MRRRRRERHIHALEKAIQNHEFRKQLDQVLALNEHHAHTQTQSIQKISGNVCSSDDPKQQKYKTLSRRETDFCWDDQMQRISRSDRSGRVKKRKDHPHTHTVILKIQL